MLLRRASKDCSKFPHVQLPKHHLVFPSQNTQAQENSSIYNHFHPPAWRCIYCIFYIILEFQQKHPQISLEQKHNYFQYIHTHTCADARAHTHTYIYTHMYACMCMCVCVYREGERDTQARTSTHISPHMYI